MVNYSQTPSLPALCQERDQRLAGTCGIVSYTGPPGSTPVSCCPIPTPGESEVGGVGGAASEIVTSELSLKKCFVGCFSNRAKDDNFQTDL